MTAQYGKVVEHVNHFKKTASEKALAKVAVKKHHADKRKLTPTYVKRKGCLGLRVNSMEQIAKLLELANHVELATN